MRRKREEAEKEKEGEWGVLKDPTTTEEEFERDRKRPFTNEANEDSLFESKPQPEKKTFTEEEDKIRFSMELEFIQSLSNPEYLFSLAQRRLFQDKAFINYLKYLLYWKKPEYAKYIVYPHSLRFLDMLQSEHFRNQLNDKSCIEFIHAQQFYHWQYYKHNRYKEATQVPPSDQQPAMQPQPIPPPTDSLTETRGPIHIESITS